MKKTIAVLSGANMRENKMGYEVGRLISGYGCALLIDGDDNSGLISIANGVKETGGQVIGISILGQSVGSHVTDVVDCQSGLHFGAEMQLGLRDGNLLSANGFIMPFDANADSIAKLLAIINLNREMPKYKKPVAILAYEDSVASWTNWLESMCDFIGYSYRDLGFLKVTSIPAEAAEWVVVMSCVVS